MSNIGNKEIMAKNLRYYVEKSGKTQKELCDIFGVATSTFNDWMKAKKYPRIDKIEIMAKYFGILKSNLIEEQTQEHKEMQNKSDAMADITLKMYEDEELFSMMKTLSKLGSEQRKVVKAVLDAYTVAGK